MGIRLGVALALLVLAGCGDSGSGGGTGGSTGRTGLRLDGTSWIGTKASVDGADRPFVAGSTVRLDFSGGAVSVHAGCNRMHGDYRLAGDRLTVGPLASTEMACAQPLMEQDAWLSRTVLASPLTAKLDGDTLTLTRPGLELVLTDRTVASPDVPLQGTAWELEATREGDAISLVPAGVRRPTLMIQRDGTVVLHTGCNSGGGTATVEGATITFGPVITTKMACADVAGQKTEAAVLGVLDGAVTWSVTERSLTLTHGDRGLIYRSAP
jgi:heat shock protein HslJ